MTDQLHQAPRWRAPHVTAAELEGASSLVGFLSAYFRSYEVALSELQKSSNMNYGTIRVFSLAGLV